MPELIMFWDEIDPIGDPRAGMRIENNHENIEIPNDACGFRLRRPGQDWNRSWYFAPPNKRGQVFSFQGISYSSSFAGNDEFVEARGPVGGCESGNYAFDTTLGTFGITGDDPVIAGAGSFIADFTDESDIEWLDFAGNAIKVEEPETSIDPVELPPEFFEQPPEVKGCFRDFEGNLQCPEDTDSAGQQANGAVSGELVFFVARNAYIIPGLVETTALSLTEVPVAAGQALEIRCPAEFRMTVRFIKSASAPAATVRYRFQFAHGPRSTVFEKRIDEPGPTTVLHSVPIPLPVLSKPTPGGVNFQASNEFAVYRPPVIEPNPIDPQLDDAILTIEPLPDNQYKGSVRVEVLNSADGIITSGWASYHLICEEGANRPVVTPGLLGPDIVSLQANLNRWNESQGRQRLDLNGRFNDETTRAVVAFQEMAGLVPDGVVGPRTWRALRRAASAPVNRRPVL